MPKKHATMFRLPLDLRTRLVREAGARTAKTAERVSINRVVIEILEAYFAASARRGGR